ncbi:hypothetical protein K469DRAFT_687230 [Zopfia rhizophila CBS 207.26]|uniref:Oxidase ustYa n=1 Tax=Zopfia rhizophila CBS 207.26 TaxID=1314779 RepID=A0A6A6E5H4_9PEZI|nr:hypothetical protein K469DRAFT_687230 [Zopfia rhizophila CBS 207.26]
MEGKHDYRNVHTDDHHEDDSSTEVESLVGIEKQWQADDFQRRSRRSKRSTCISMLKASRWVIIISLQLVIIGLLARDQGLLLDQWWRTRTTSEKEIGGDVTGWGPHLPTQITTFKINQTFAPYNTSEFFKPETMRAWNELMPHGMGFQWVNHTERYHDLPTPIVWPNKTVFTTSMTHQLHCLFAVVEVYSGLTSNTPLPEDHHWHMIHCFDYMRQAIMCSADMALEGLETTFPDHNGGSDGWDSKHVCRDYSAVYSYLESVRAYDDQQIF